MSEPKTTEPLILIGYWSGPDAPDWPDPRKFVDEKWDEDERDMVAQHLGWGRLFRVWFGLSTCRLCGQLNGSVDMTDGVYAWPEGLVHYVTRHGVRLPQEFVDHVRAYGDPYADAEVNEEWWRGQR